ncbi:hypothetical protein PV11_09474 [Exophiala sideris]|uniref:NACHT domain-containing protein n=1 Tax=Exophiala sideris TaxID=1016849 RepID=A0A0D1WRI2_9EURO|nr:hypothetical protein PV11_09474 [Exophiala sideris]
MADHPKTVQAQIEPSDYKATENILQSLWYPGMRERVDQLQQAHGATYKWVLRADVNAAITPAGSALSSRKDNWKSTTKDLYTQGLPMGDILEYMKSHYSLEVPGQQHRRQYLATLGAETRKHPSPKWDHFSSWLGSKHPPKNIYWISGKVGSGKSTLMRYLDVNINQNEHMQPWADGVSLLKARYFFWNPAKSSLQKSLVGLLRSLLFQLFEQSSESISSCVPSEKWKIAHRHDPPLEWTEMELQETMKKYLDLTCRSSRILLIIDGLDEVEGSSRKVEGLLLFLDQTSKHKHVKICVSGRPWTVFQDAFQGFPKLQLEDLTHADIQSFVLETLKSHRRFRYVQRLDPLGSEGLANRIVEKAEGVFLWATLVVKELLQSLRDGEGVKELFRLLDGIPADLDEHFRRIIDSVPVMHQREASIIFQIALHEEQYFLAANPIRLMDLSFLDAAGSTDFALDWQPERDTLDFSDREAILFRLDSTLRKLNSRCLGMLECFYYPGEVARSFSVSTEDYKPPLNPSTMYEECLNEGVFLPIIQEVAHTRQHKLFPFDFGVDFLHRSLRDFMISDGLQRLRQGSNDDFDPRTYLRSARLIQAQQIQAAGLCSPVASAFCSYVLSTLGLPGYRTSVVSAQLAHKIRATVESIPGSDDYFPSLWYLDASLNMWQTECSNFLTVAIDFGLEAYIQQELHGETVLGKRGRPILDYILRPRFVEPPPSLQIGRQSPSIDLVQYVLDHGGDPNEHWDGSSVWALFLCFIATIVKNVRMTETHKQDYFVALVTLIQHGASPMIPKPWLSVEAYFDMVQDPWPTIQDTTEEPFRSRWGAVDNAMAEDGNDNPLCDVRDLVECFVHPEIFDSQQVKHLQLLLGDTQDSEPAPSTSKPGQDHYSV